MCKGCIWDWRNALVGLKFQPDKTHEWEDPSLSCIGLNMFGEEMQKSANRAWLMGMLASFQRDFLAIDKRRHPGSAQKCNT